jgi:type IV pilus assembly protein PilV
MHLRPGLRGVPQSGFSIIEVLVTIVVVSVALLGVAKMQAASVSNTQVARTRSLVALQAESLASLMHGNRLYWSDPTAVQASWSSTGAVAPTTACSGGNVCAAKDMASADWNNWLAGLYSEIPTYSATVGCATATSPVTCLITITWTEKSVAINSSTASAAAQVTSQPYTLLVTP